MFPQFPDPHNFGLLQTLRDRGVVIHAPAATCVRDLVPEQFEPGVEIHPGCTVTGRDTWIGRGTHLGRAGGGWFENLRAGRGCDLYGGVFSDCVLLDGVTVRGHAEIRGGTLLEEHGEAAHHVGYKMTVALPYVIAGSLVNFCDALVAGGTGRSDHTEIGSATALYNFTPAGDKFASLLGDVPSGVFLRSRPIFVGGQTQVVSPVAIGFGAVIPAGGAVRRSVPAGRLFAEPPAAVDRPYDPDRYGALGPKVAVTAAVVGNLWALDRFYAEVRLPFTGAMPFHHAEEPFLRALYTAARVQIRAGISERVKRLYRLVQRLPRSLELHRAAGDAARVAEHEAVLAAWPELGQRLATEPVATPQTSLAPVREALDQARIAHPEASLVDLLRLHLDDATVAAGRAALQAVVDAVTAG